MKNQALQAALLLAIVSVLLVAGLLARTRTLESPSEVERIDTASGSEPVLTAPAPASMAPVTRLQIPSIGVDASAVTLGVDLDGTMQSPKGPKEVAWYTFSSQPGYAGNVVISGHVDYANYGPAVFWRLRELKSGDKVIVYLEDGTSFSYEVATVTAYDADTAPVAAIVGPTPEESITLITCTGVFDRTSRDYDKRLVVRGLRLPGA